MSTQKGPSPGCSPALSEKGQMAGAVAVCSSSSGSLQRIFHAARKARKHRHERNGFAKLDRADVCVRITRWSLHLFFCGDELVFRIFLRTVRPPRPLPHIPHAMSGFCLFTVPDDIGPVLIRRSRSQAKDQSRRTAAGVPVSPLQKTQTRRNGGEQEKIAPWRRARM